MNKIYLVLSIAILSFTSCKNSIDSSRETLLTTINPGNSNIEYMGRVETNDSITEIYWSGTSMKIEFEGKDVSTVLDDENGTNFFNVIIDNDSVYTLNLDKGKKEYQLAENLSEGKHTIQLFKRTEWTKGKTSFYGFNFKEPTRINAIDEKKLAIEFYGNSITSAYAVEDYTGADSPDSIYTNNYLSYATLTAHHFDADYTCISRSGIGVAISWFPMIMPEMYDRLNPDDENSKWDFTKSNPDVVVINLFQNDSWLVNLPDEEQFDARFDGEAPSDEFLTNAYADFVKTIRSKYSDTQIVCVLGNMDITAEGSKWPNIVSKAVESINDSKIYTISVPYKGTKGHPRVEEQKIIADNLISFIEMKSLINHK